VPKKQNPKKLIISIIIDLIGALPTIIGMVGAPATAFTSFIASESFDIIWAPISGVLIYALFKDVKLAFFGFGEELLPITDIIPTATITYIKHHVNDRKRL